MATEVAGLASIQQKVTERIRATFVELIPEEMFVGLIKEETDKFIKVTLPLLIQAELKEGATAFIKAELAKPGWQDRWQGNGYATGDLMQRVIKEAAPDLVAGMFSQMASQIVMNIRNGGFLR